MAPVLNASAIPTRQIERDDFPFEFLSEIAEAESWRKEVYRPIYHLHKWWAQRLGSVFRAIILGAAPGQPDDVMKAFYSRVDLSGTTVFDPFMGSGTTVGEAAKLGCAAVGRDINPVAFNGVRVALQPVNRDRLEKMFQALDAKVGSELRGLYRALDDQGRPCDVLYFFWVKVARCPGGCEKQVDLFSSYVFAKHAYAKKFPSVHMVCPDCGEVFKGRNDQAQASCPSCSLSFNPHEGPAHSATATCRSCSLDFPIARTLGATGKAPEHRLFAKLVLTADGEKRYLRATTADATAYRSAERKLRGTSVILPEGTLTEGHNTKQAINYGYREWRDFFNSRQLLALGTLARAISELPASPERDALALVFSGTLEFNNMFASYKGEGTGAVRHMFSHHVLKPERTPIEANPWGLPQSSGSFSTLYKSRLVRALDYRDNPFEVTTKIEEGRVRGGKAFGTSAPLSNLSIHPWEPRPTKPGVYVSCGDSAQTGLAEKSVHLVVTDPPFFDNVHYSELADFFFAWQRRLLPVDAKLETTRQAGEVQDRSAAAFALKLAGVFQECRRVLVDEGLLIFSYHHSRDDGWSSVAEAVLKAGFTLVQAHPIKAEMSVASPKQQASEPIDIDILMVCRKREADRRARRSTSEVVNAAERAARACLERFLAQGRALSRNDAKVLLLSRLLVEASAGRDPEEAARTFAELVPTLTDSIDALHRNQVKAQRKPEPKVQLDLGLEETP